MAKIGGFASFARLCLEGCKQVARALHAHNAPSHSKEPITSESSANCSSLPSFATLGQSVSKSDDLRNEGFTPLGHAHCTPGHTGSSGIMHAVFNSNSGPYVATLAKHISDRQAHMQSGVKTVARALHVHHASHHYDLSGVRETF